jgi:hypothetical protein
LLVELKKLKQQASKFAKIEDLIIELGDLHLKIEMFVSISGLRNNSVHSAQWPIQQPTGGMREKRLW